MHVMMTKEQFDMLKQKAKSGGAKGNGKEKKEGEGEEKLPEIKLKEEDDTHGTLDTDDVMMNYYYNSQEGRLYLSVAKKHTLAAYVAGDNISGTYIMDILSQIPNPKPKSGAGASGTDKDGGSESQEKKDQNQHQPASQ